jgi:hypothetical protein
MPHRPLRPFDPSARRRRSGKAGLVGTLMLGALAVGGYFGWLFVPPYWTHLKMAEITESVALDWSQLNRNKATRRLDEEFRRQEIPNYIPDDACKLEERGTSKIVACAWSIDVYYVPTDYYKTLHFTTRVEAGPGGNILSEG